MVRRKGRSGYYFRKVYAGKVKLIALGTDREAACRKLRSLKSDGPPRVEILVREAARQWLESYVAVHRTLPRDQQLARRRVEMYLDPFLGDHLLQRVTRDHLRGYRLYLERLGHLKPQSVRHILADARCFLRWCEDSGLIDRAPIPMRLLPRVQERPPNRLTDDEVERILRIPEPYAFIFRLGLGTGLRWGELVRATSTDLQKGWLIVHHTKSGKKRKVPLSPALQEELRLRVGRLLPIKDGSGFARQVRKYSGVKRFHPHQMRHTFACRWLEQGRSLDALKRVLGHSTIVVTERYGQVSDEFVRHEAERDAGESASNSASKRR